MGITQPSCRHICYIRLIITIHWWLCGGSDGYVQNTHTHTVHFELRSPWYLVKTERGGCHSCMKEIWKQNYCHGNITVCIISQGRLLLPSVSYIAPLFPEIFLILWLFLYCHRWWYHFANLRNTKPWISLEWEKILQKNTTLLHFK